MTMSNAAGRIAAIDQTDAAELCDRAQTALDRLVGLMNEETTLLRAGHFRDLGPLTAQKTQAAQDYVGLARAVQRQGERLARDAPVHFAALHATHERLATQMAENLRVVATMKRVTDDLLSDVAETVGRRTRTNTYSARGVVGGPAPSAAAHGIAVNRTL